jgi:3-mercaptopyruvate sulfurtransferase SseA
MKKRCLLALSFVPIVMLLLLAGYGSAFALVASQPDFPNAGLLVSDGSVQNSIGEENLVIIDARTAGYSASHIPSAIHLKYGDYMIPGMGLKKLTTLKSQLGAAGIGPNMKIVIYDDTTASWGAAGRVFWMLEYLGCNDVHILDGGWDKWVADKRPTESGIRTLPPKTFVAVVNKSIRATSSHIMERLTSLDETDSFDDFAVVDARTNEEYNGWKFYGEARGGHIPKAVNIPYEWFFGNNKKVVKYQELKKTFENRGITTDKEVTSYCTAGIRSGYVYFLLRLMGYPRVSNYDGSILEWSADSSLPMSKLPRYRMIVNAAWVNDLISGKNPQTYPGHGYVVLELVSDNTGDPIDAYNAGHIPGALHLNIRSWNKDYPIVQCTIDNGKLLYGAELQTKIERRGITKDTTVVLYEYWDATWAARIAWALLYAGVKDVRILNGGWRAWVEGGYPVETTPNYGQHADFGAVVPVHPEYRCETSDVTAMMSDPSSTIADTRSWDEYIGLSTGYPYDPCWPEEWKGRVPGAVWAHDWDWYFHWKNYNAWLEDNGNNSLRSYNEVEQMFKKAGLTPDKTKIASYCGGGYRASLPFIYTYMMGYTNMCNYDGSMYEWFFPGTNPIETGYPTNWESIGMFSSYPSDQQFIEKDSLLNIIGTTK